jgi:hypothetical protein
MEASRMFWNILKCHMLNVRDLLLLPVVNRMVSVLVPLALVAALGMLGFSVRQSEELLRVCNVSIG